MAQQIFYQDPNTQTYNASEAYKPIDTVTVQTASSNLGVGQFSPITTPGPGYVVQADPLLPSYEDLGSPGPSAPVAAPIAQKRIARKPVGGHALVQAPAPLQPSVPAHIPVQGPTYPSNIAAQSVPSYENVPVASPTAAIPPYAPGSPIPDAPAYAPTSPVNDVPSYQSLQQIPTVPSSPSTVYSPTFSPITPSDTLTAIPTSPTSPTFAPAPPVPVGGYPRLTKPIVIPQVLNHTSHQDVIGKPFTRCYANVLANYNLTQDAFLEFLDQLNIDNIGHVGFDYTRKAGKVIRAAGAFDPTGITKLVGSSVKLSASLGSIAYVKGPVSKRHIFLSKANKEIFSPRGLKVSTVHGKALRKILGVDPKFPLCAPLMTSWVVPSREQLSKGQRAKIRVAGRIFNQLAQHAEDLVLVREANDTLIVTGTLGQRKAAKSVRDWQVASEVQHEIWRGEALALYERAKNAVTEKEKQKLLKKAAQVDKELVNVEKISWLVIQNLDGGTNPLVTV